MSKAQNHGQDESTSIAELWDNWVRYLLAPATLLSMEYYIISTKLNIIPWMSQEKSSAFQTMIVLVVAWGSTLYLWKDWEGRTPSWVTPQSKLQVITRLTTKQRLQSTCWCWFELITSGESRTVTLQMIET